MKKTFGLIAILAVLVAGYVYGGPVISGGGGGSMTYPGAGLPITDGSSWSTSLTATPAYGVVGVSAGGQFVVATSLQFNAMDMSSSSYSIPWVVGTATGATGEGRGYWNSSNDILYIGTGSAAKQMASVDGSETLTNKILTSPLIQSTEVIIATDTTLVATQAYGTRVNTYGAVGAIEATLPTAAAGMDVVFVWGTATAATYSVNAAAGEALYYNSGTGARARVSAAKIGDYFVVYSFKTGASTWSWILKNGQGTVATY